MKNYYTFSFGELMSGERCYKLTFYAPDIGRYDRNDSFNEDYIDYKLDLSTRIIFTKDKDSSPNYYFYAVSIRILGFGICFTIQKGY